MEWPLVGRGDALDHAMELVEAGKGVAILGRAGVGKSRLVHEIVELAEHRGTPVVRAVASQSISSIPFAPFVELLPIEPTRDRLVLLSEARRALEAHGGPHAAIVAVDDAHHLDRASLAFLVSIVGSNTATVVLSARTGEPMEAELVDLWTNGVIERMELDHLDRNQGRQLVEAAIGPISDQLDDELWLLSGGNPLVLHELIEGAKGRSIEQSDEVWELVGSLTDSPRLADLVVSRLRALPADLRPAMDVVAVGAPLPVELARAAVGDALTGLEEQSLVESVDVGAARMVVPAHPLYGEVLKANLGESRTYEALKALLQAANEHPGAMPDPLRLALWQRDTAEIVSDEIALAGATAALVRHDPALAAELVEPLNPGDVRVGLILGRSLSYRQRFDEAEAVLAALDPTEPHHLAEVASTRGQNFAFGLGQIERAQGVFDAAGTIEDPQIRARLMNERAMVSAIHGDFVDARKGTESVLADAATSDVARASAYITLTIALAMTADCERLDEVIDDATEVSQRVGQVLPFAHDQIGIMETMSMVNAGRFREAIARGELAVADRERQALASTWLSTLALCAAEAGRLRHGFEAAERALVLQREYDPFGLEPQTHGLMGLARGQMGDHRLGEVLESIELPAPAPRLTIWIDRGRAWAAAAKGDLDGAARIASQGGRRGVAGEHFSWAAFCFHDAVRFGFPDLVIEDLRAIDSSRGAYFIAALQEHAEAMFSGDPAGLEAVGLRFSGMSLPLLAAEAFARASQLYEGIGEHEDAARACAISKAAQARCDSARTPSLSARPEVVTDREAELAIDAAHGMTSPQIAEERFISVRTVDNHLRSVYRKLGVSGRSELSAALQPAVRFHHQD
jgi:DNA-binding CsgD family transcriptional regulator/tetratricopeptide (TPR) repeat protein